MVKTFSGFCTCIDGIVGEDCSDSTHDHSDACIDTNFGYNFSTKLFILNLLTKQLSNSDVGIKGIIPELYLRVVSLERFAVH